MLTESELSMDEVYAVLDRKQMHPVSQHLFDTIATHVQAMIAERVEVLTDNLSINAQAARASVGIHDAKPTDLSVAGSSEQPEKYR